MDRLESMSHDAELGVSFKRFDCIAIPGVQTRTYTHSYLHFVLHTEHESARTAL